MPRKEAPPPRPSLKDRFPDVYFSEEKTEATPFRIFDRDLDEELYVSEPDHITITQRRVAEAREAQHTTEGLREKEIRRGFRQRFSLLRLFSSKRREDDRD